MIIHKSRNAIMSSKMFKASPRQKEILAAIDDEANVELVQQLDEYLDDEYLILKQSSEAEFSEETDETINDASDDDMNTDDTNDNGASGPAPAKFTPNKSLMEKHGDELAELEGETPDEPTDDDKTEDANASVKAKGKAIVADTVVNPFVDLYASFIGIANEIKGTLNVRSDTAGVNRVQIKNDELWIYYNDDINLNNVMANVLNVLTAANYRYFEFNRLARTDNAMVFTISVENSASGIVGDTNEK